MPTVQLNLQVIKQNAKRNSTVLTVDFLSSCPNFYYQSLDIDYEYLKKEKLNSHQLHSNLILSYLPNSIH